jgi:phosphopantothenoylcysteine decarboxylase / phosphopantothenate---cysteine ligase
VLLGVSGGIAAYKAALVARLLTSAGAEVSVILTENATRFVGADTFSALTGAPAHTSLWERPCEVLHVRLARRADVAVVAPATANVLARLAQGLADDLLSATLLEAVCPLVVAPAMHTGMWEHPATQANVATLRDRGARVVGPVSGPLAHGDEGPGRLAEPEDIVGAIRAALAPQDLAGRRVLITAGPTHEPIDPVRFLGNRSSGRMGVAIAEEALGRGATVTLVYGPGTVPTPAGAEVVPVETAEQMREAVLERLDGSDAVVMTAAVADFRPKEAAGSKLKKEAGVPELLLEPTPDILAELGERRSGQVLVGFAAETDELEAAGRAKLAAKHLDLIVVNRVGRKGTGFGSETNEAMLLSADGDDEPLETRTKSELARLIADRLASSLRERPPSVGPDR